MADFSADADTSANLDSSYGGSPLAQFSSRVGQLRSWQEQQRARLMRQQEQHRHVIEQKQAELASLLAGPGSNVGAIPRTQPSGNTAEQLASPVQPLDGAEPVSQSHSKSGAETFRMSPLKQPGSSGPTEHENTPLQPVSFETLLERELQRQTSAAATATATPSEAATTPGSAKRPFLKRGAGLERFRLRPGHVMRLKPSGRGGGGREIGSGRGAGGTGRGGGRGRGRGVSGRGKAGTGASRGGGRGQSHVGGGGDRIVLHSAPRGNGPSRPAPGNAPSAAAATTAWSAGGGGPFAPGSHGVHDPGDTLALLGDVRLAGGPGVGWSGPEGRAPASASVPAATAAPTAAPAAAPAAWAVGAGSLARPPQPGLSLRHRLATDGGATGLSSPPLPAPRLAFPTIGRLRSHLPGGVITLDKVARPTGGAQVVPGQVDAGTPRGKREQKELKAFEILEQAAQDSSFCSNSSFVSNLLHAASSTPERRPGASVPLSPLAGERTSHAAAGAAGTTATARATATAGVAATVTTASVTASTAAATARATAVAEARAATARDSAQAVAATAVRTEKGTGWTTAGRDIEGAEIVEVDGDRRSPGAVPGEVIGGIAGRRTGGQTGRSVDSDVRSGEIRPGDDRTGRPPAVGEHRAPTVTASKPATQQTSSYPWSSSVVRPNVAAVRTNRTAAAGVTSQSGRADWLTSTTGRSDWSASVTGRSDWMATTVTSEASRHSPSVLPSLDSPYARAPDTDVSADPSPSGSPAHRGMVDVLDERDDLLYARDDAQGDASDAETGDRLERYRRLRDQMRHELECRERAAASAADPSPPPSTESLRRSVRFDDHPNVFEITADMSGDVTLTSETGAGVVDDVTGTAETGVGEESSAWELTGVSSDGSPNGVTSGERSGLLSSTERHGRGQEPARGQLEGSEGNKNSSTNGAQFSGQPPRLDSAPGSGQLGPTSLERNARGHNHSPPVATLNGATRSESSSRGAGFSNVSTTTTTSTASAVSASAAASAPAGQPNSRTRNASTHEPFLFDRAGLERQRSALERELATFRAENALLSQLKAEVQQQRLAMDEQREQWEKWQREEKEKMARRVEEERRKLAEERAKFEAEKKKHAEEWKKRETPELKVLNGKISELEAELQRRGGSWSQDAVRLRSRVAQLTADRERLEDLLKTAQQQLARQNARQFSAGVGPHSGGGGGPADRPSSASRRRQSVLSRHRSAPDLADSGGSTTSVSTAGGRSSRASLVEQSGKKLTRGGGSRRSLESRSSAGSPTIDDVRRLLESAGGTGVSTSGGGGKARRSGSGARAESVPVPRQPPPPVRVVRNSALAAVSAPSPLPPPLSTQAETEEARAEAAEARAREAEERMGLPGGSDAAPGVDAALANGVGRYRGDERTAAVRGERMEMLEERRRGAASDVARPDVRSRVEPDRGQESRTGAPREERAGGREWMTPDRDSYVASSAAASAMASSPFSWPGQVADTPPPPPPVSATRGPPPAPARDPALALSYSTLSSSSALSLPPRSLPAAPAPASSTAAAWLGAPSGVPAGATAETSSGRTVETPSGRRDKLSDGTIRVCYHNGDWKETGPQGDTVYFYAESGTRQTTYSSGAELTEFPSGQIERRDPDGTTEIRYPCGSVTVLLTDGEQRTVYPDGTRRRLLADGSEEVLLPSGKLEVHTDRYKKLVCPDGTIKFVYPDGRQETRYPNGRIRIRDRDGRLVVDTQP